MPVGEMTSTDDIAIMGRFFRFLFEHADSILKYLKTMDIL